MTNTSPIEHDVAIAQGSAVARRRRPMFAGGSKTLTLTLKPGQVHLLLHRARPPPGRHGRHADGLVKLYVCWGTFPTPRPGGHPCANAYHALKDAGHDPEVIKSYGFAPLPAALNSTAGRRRGAGADRQTLGARARARRRHRRARLARDRRVGRRQPGGVGARRPGARHRAGASSRVLLRPAAKRTARRRPSGEVEARHAGAHRDADARVGARQQLVAEAVALGAEGEQRTRGQLAPARSARRPGRARAAAARRRRAAPRLSTRATGSAKCSPAAPRSASGDHGSWLPVLSTPATSAAAATRTHAPMLPRSRGSSSSDDRLAALAGEHVGRIDGGALGERHHAGARRQRGELREHLRLDLLRQRGDLRRDVRRQLGGEALELVAVAAHDLVHLGAEAQRVLERVKAFEHDERAIAPRAPEARDERSCRHWAIMAAIR